MKLKENKKLILSIIIIVLIISIAGGSLAKWSWGTDESQKTLVTVNLEDSYLTISGGDVTKTGMYPTKYCNGEAALIGEIATVTAENNTELDMEVILKINATLNIKQGSLSEENKGKINWAIVETSSGGTTCENTPYKGTFSGVTTGKDIDTGIKFIVPAKERITKNYRIYVWVDSTYKHTNSDEVISDPMQNLNIKVNFSQSSELSQSFLSIPNAPVLDNGMIPVKISADGVVTTVDSDDDTWYNYLNKEWANVVLVKENGTQTRNYYKSNIGVTVAEDDILAYYVWIPRYKYKIWTLDNSSAGQEQSIDIAFEKSDAQITQGNQVGDYITHPAFIWDNTPISGIWVGKFETSHSTLASSTTNNNLGCTNENCSNADGLIIKPDVVSLKYNNISNSFYASRSMTRGGNPFGLNSTITDMHMIKNSEWAAAAYLSHSRYGINSEIYINNSSDYITGRSGGNVAGSVNTVIVQFGRGSENQYARPGYYTWVGQKITVSGSIGDYDSNRTLGTRASTTGNVTGVYDMSGGVDEFVMGNYNDYLMSSGFEIMPNSKYYDKYTTTSVLTACNGNVCLGHALSEVSGWYSDRKAFSYASVAPWIVRGGQFDDDSSAGVWSYSPSEGNSQVSPYYVEHGFRVAAIVKE